MEEYLKQKVLQNFSASVANKIHFQFFTEIPKQKKRKREPLNPNYSLNDLQSLFESKDKKNLQLFYQVIFEDESVFPELMKKLPNRDLIPQKMIPKISKKIKKIDK